MRYTCGAPDMLDVKKTASPSQVYPAGEQAPICRNVAISGTYLPFFKSDSASFFSSAAIPIVPIASTIPANRIAITFFRMTLSS